MVKQVKNQAEYDYHRMQTELATKNMNRVPMNMGVPAFKASDKDYRSQWSSVIN